MRRLAAIDLGTNTVRLLVVEASGAEWRGLHAEQRVTRLGEGQAGTGSLQPAAMRRTVEVVAAFCRRAEDLGVHDVRIVGTSAVREAQNGAEFLAQVRSSSGRQVRVISGEEEARLTLLGVTEGLPDLRGDFLLFDIGGGSTEFVLSRAGRASQAVSVMLGVVELAERFMDQGPVDHTRYDAMAAEIGARLTAGLTEPILRHGAPALVGSAGTVTTLAALDLGLESYDPARVHGHRLTRVVVAGLVARLAAQSLAERAALPCLEPGRADLIVPGAAIFLAALDRLGFDALVVSDRGLREGILYEILAEH
ncbi:MAG: Ppx/GppA phosphatase family protein [Candidatus Rokubacteria bacterium]|nr:Ppx/GppA phosphatase family protein [Candidatus Rokubacteria bacterium]